MICRKIDRRTGSMISVLLLMFLAACQKPAADSVVITTPLGDISVRLYDETREYQKNFISLTKEGFYDSLLFHRVIPDIIIQGGDPDSKYAPAGKYLGRGGVDYTLKPDFRYVHTYGAVAAARRPDQVNPQKESSGSQFYIVMGHPVSDKDLDRIESEKGFRYTEEQRKLYKLIGGIPEFDGDYTVFGEVTAGMDAVERISRTPRDADDRPREDIRMEIKLKNENGEN